MNEPATSALKSSTDERHPLRNPAYRRWLIGSATSMLGDQFYLVALPWLVLQELGSSETLGTVMMAAALPRMALALIGGVVSDRFSARRVMLVAAAVRAVCVAAIGLLTWAGWLAAWEVYALVIVFGAADAFAMPAQNAYLPALLTPGQLVAGISLGQSVSTAAYILGPVPAGLIIGHSGAGTAFMIDAASFAVIIFALLGLPDPPLAPRPESTSAAIVDGIAQVVNDVPLRTLLLMVTALNLFLSGCVEVGLPYLASSKFGSSAAYGAILSVGAVGALLATLFASAWKVRRRGVLILVGLAVVGVGLASIPFVPGLRGATAVVFVMCFASCLANVHMYAWVMQRVDATSRGRVSSVMVMVATATAPLSMAAAGYVAKWSLTGLFALCGVGQVIVTACGAVLRSVREME